MKNKTLVFTMFFLCLSSATKVWSDVEIIDKEASPLEIETSILYTDNLNPTLEGKAPAIGVSISPQGSLIAATELAWFELNYQADIQQYRVSDNENFEDNQRFNSYQANIISRFFFTEAWYLDAKVEHAHQTQHYGSGISRLKNNIVEADQLNVDTVSASLVYGSDTSTRFLSLTAGVVQNKYQENNNYSALFNVEQQYVEANLSYIHSSASKIVMQVTAKNEDYEAIARDDSKLVEGLIGFEWNSGGKSRLQLLVGKYQRTFTTEKSSNGLSWNSIYEYQPREDLKFSISSSRTSASSISEFTSDTVSQTVNGTINYLYSNQWQFGVSASSKNTQFKKDDRPFELNEKDLGAHIKLQLNEHSELKLALSLQDLETSDQVFDFSQSEVRMTWHYGF